MLKSQSTTSRCIRSSALWLYQLATAGHRRYLKAHLHSSANVPVAILFYHRIADDQSNTWTMSRRDFAMQLDWLQSHFDVVSLQEAQRRIRSRNNRWPTVAITFDDGYSENLANAFPQMAKRGIPATYFVSTDFVRTGRTFPHDLENGQHLAPNTIDELKRITDQGFELGAHTRSHCDLGSTTNREKLWSEIVGSAQDIESWCNVEVKYFSFPTGLPCNTSQLAVDVIREAGFEGFCTAYGAWNWPGSDGYHLRRIHADPGLQSLKNWLTYDPRKLIERQRLPFDETDLSVTKLQTNGC